MRWVLGSKVVQREATQLGLNAHTRPAAPDAQDMAQAFLATSRRYLFDGSRERGTEERPRQGLRRAVAVEVAAVRNADRRLEYEGRTRLQTPAPARAHSGRREMTRVNPGDEPANIVFWRSVREGEVAMLKVLLPVDGSDCALNAVRWVIRLAKENGPVNVRLLSVFFTPVRLGDVGIAVTPAQMEEIERRQTDPALATAERFLREAAVAYERETRAAGDVAEMIAKRADELGCDAIVMGTRGAGALSKLILGSVAAKVVQIAKVPVTLVK